MYVRNVSDTAYDLKNITYSSLTCCAADFVNGTAYRLKDCTGVSLSGCGCESVTGTQFDIQGSRVFLDSFRSVNPKRGEKESLIILSSAVDVNCSYLPDYSDGSSPKYTKLDGAIVNSNNSIFPDHSNDRIAWGVVQSIINISDEKGAYSVAGNSTYVVLGRVEGGVITVLSQNPPTGDANTYPAGTRWELLYPSVTGPYKWIWLADNTWHVTGSIL
ncbi:hypothetical protein AB1E22_17135 [Buttiauxella gaviniae]|uniref:Uncharacterized protein n=1 Tax=Buttiauxella gaviniae TaxID=82990 RepID=A0ABV3NXW3_9ENTR